jgi:hypothetical protein
MHLSLRMFAAVVGAAILASGGVSSANAAKGSPGPANLVCSGGDIVSGTYKNVTVTGVCTVPDGADVMILGNLVVDAGATFDAQTHSMVTIMRNVSAGPGSFFGLGCTEAHPCSDGVPGTQTDKVYGNVTLDHVFDAAINGDWIGGNLTSVGGGAGLLDPETQFVPFSIKDDVVEGNISVTGLTTVWFGIIRTEVGKNVIVKDVSLSDPDGNEIVANTIGGNLICLGNSPGAQLGDAVEDGPPGYGPNTVGKKAIGECAALVG